MIIIMDEPVTSLKGTETKVGERRHPRSMPDANL